MTTTQVTTRLHTSSSTNAFMMHLPTGYVLKSPAPRVAMVTATSSPVLSATSRCPWMSQSLVVRPARTRRRARPQSHFRAMRHNVAMASWTRERTVILEAGAMCAVRTSASSCLGATALHPMASAAMRRPAGLSPHRQSALRFTRPSECSIIPLYSSCDLVLRYC